ncbi:NADH-quinone oxidoreductase subunit C [Bremerella cremea]|uniref:NADH-quinone oxidoreductase subunit C n=1 Tax=Bremerella cremea TaxID=1031537 RepID=A0A368KQ13_9BACT|nr:NADH-quinone oxidoreductase subunit C [Bremerella cremea]RCS47711.1 NADH-quinone oxidoreductase subunit C [Bremerella cremea]
MVIDESLVQRLKQQFGEKIVGANLENVDPWIEVAPGGLVEVCRFLRDEPATRCDYLNSICVVDYCEVDPKKAAKAKWEPHLEVVYHLSSIRLKTSGVLKVKLPRWQDNVEGQLPEVPSVCEIWPTANWHEREAYDLSGVNFGGHPDLRRILCPEDWVGFPLRKDYEMPLEYHGIRGR